MEYNVGKRVIMCLIY